MSNSSRKSFISFVVAVTVFSVCASSTLSVNAENVYHGSVTKTYNQVNSLIEQKQYKKATDELRKMLAQNPHNLKARTMLGSIYVKQYKLDAAYKEFSLVLDEDSENSYAHNGMGEVYFNKTTSSDMQIIKNKDKFYNMALREFKLALNSDSENDSAYNNAGKVFEKMGEISKAETYYAKAVEINPENSNAVCNLGHALFLTQKVDDAIAHYRKAIGLNSKNSTAYYRLGEAMISQGKYSEAIRELNTSLYLFPNSAPAHNMIGKAYELQGNSAAAINSYRKASFIKPEFSAPYLNIADIYQSRGDNDLAIAELKNAIAVNPRFREGFLKIADISMIENKLDQAISNYRQLVEDKQYAPLALKGLSKAYFRKAKEASSLASMVSPSEYIHTEQALLQALDYNPQDLQLYLALLRISKLKGSDYQARMYLNKIVKDSKFSPINAIVKGEAYLTFNKYNEAQSEFKKALSFVNNANDSVYLGEIFIMNRQYEVAKQAFYKALNMDSNNQKAQIGLNMIVRNMKLSDTHYKIAHAFYSENQRMAAIEELKKSLQMNPKNPKAQRLIGEAYDKMKYYHNAKNHYEAYVNLIHEYDGDYTKYKKKIEWLDNKIEQMKSRNQLIKTL